MQKKVFGFVKKYSSKQRNTGFSAKKPSQSRSQLTLHALQDAFVRVLIDRGYKKMTIREVVSVAGVGIGTFYDYVPNLRALAASTINQRCMTTAQILKDQMAGHSGLSLSTTVEYLLKSLVKEGFGNPKEWTALLLLGRQVSSASTLKKIHDEFVHIWSDAIRHSSLAISEELILSNARMAHTISYGWYSHDLLFYVDDPRYRRSIDEITHAIVGIIQLSQNRG
ncbi:MAG: TetR/AcrR family transcriptional regulator [Limnohabitans sp.]